MEEQVDDLATHLLQRLKTLPEDSKLLVAVVGIPASGKTTVAAKVAAKVNASYPKREGDEGGDVAIVVGLDGWHFPRAILDTFDDPKEAHDRRGAAFTFDGASFVNFVSKLRTSPMQPHYAPSFSHSKKDPVENDIPVLPANRLVIFEGLYLTLRDQPWSKAGEMWDESYLVQVDVKTARERLVERHVRTGVAKDKAEAEWRADSSDIPNGEYVLANTLEPTKRLPSIDDPRFTDVAN